MSAPPEEVILEKYRSLPPQRQVEADHFLDFLKASEARVQAADRLRNAFEKLDALNLPPMTPEEIQKEIDGARAERRAQNADRR